MTRGLQGTVFSNKNEDVFFIFVANVQALIGELTRVHGSSWPPSLADRPLTPRWNAHILPGNSNTASEPCTNWHQQQEEVQASPFSLQTMVTFLLHALLAVMFLPVVMLTNGTQSPVLTFDPAAVSDQDAYCQMLLQSSVPEQQIPWFCVCTRCQNTRGPKGNRGDEGLPGNLDLYHDITDHTEHFYIILFPSDRK